MGKDNQALENKEALLILYTGLTGIYTKGHGTTGSSISVFRAYKHLVGRLSNLQNDTKEGHHRLRASSQGRQDAIDNTSQQPW